MNSEVWVCLLEKERCLPFVLVEKGFDVWVWLSLQWWRSAFLTTVSLGTTVGTNILKNRSIIRPRLLNSGTSVWMSLRFTIFLTQSTTSCRLLNREA